MESIENSEVSEWYRDKTVFMTGGTGFMGKVLVEKLLRSCPVRKIYLLVRPKKGADIRQRIDDMLNYKVSKLLILNVFEQEIIVCCMHKNLSVYSKWIINKVVKPSSAFVKSMWVWIHDKFQNYSVSVPHWSTELESRICISLVKYDVFCISHLLANIQIFLQLIYNE